MTDTTKLTPEQAEALIQWRHDPGSRGLTNAATDPESAAEIESYVVRDEAAA